MGKQIFLFTALLMVTLSGNSALAAENTPPLYKGTCYVLDTNRAKEKDMGLVAKVAVELADEKAYDVHKTDSLKFQLQATPVPSEKDKKSTMLELRVTPPDGETWLASAFAIFKELRYGTGFAVNYEAWEFICYSAEK